MARPRVFAPMARGVFPPHPSSHRGPWTSHGGDGTRSSRPSGEMRERQRRLTLSGLPGRFTRLRVVCDFVRLMPLGYGGNPAPQPRAGHGVSRSKGHSRRAKSDCCGTQRSASSGMIDCVGIGVRPSDCWCGLRPFLGAVVVAGTVGGVCAAAAIGQGAATRVKITHWDVGFADLFSPQIGAAPGKTLLYCAGRSPIALFGSYTIRGPRHVPAWEIWRRNGRVYDTLHIKDLNNPSGLPPALRGPGSPAFLEVGHPFVPDGNWSLTIKEFGKVIGSSSVTLASKRC